MTFVDVLGLYAKDVHFFFNYYLAKYLCLDDSSGFSYGENSLSTAYVIAWMAQRMDEDETTEPFSGVEARHRYHFPDNKRNRTVENDPEIYAAMDTISRSGDIIQFGVYLHIYGDTFAHQDFGDVLGHGASRHKPDEPFRHKERDKRMAESVYMFMYELAKARKVCCDFQNKSFDDFWNRIETTLYMRSTDEDERVAEWQQLISKDFALTVNAIRLPPNASDSRMVQWFRAYARRVPMWHQ